MGSRYASAHEEIRAILQREPLLTAKQLWHALTVWPLPSIRTITRVAQEVKRDLAIGRELAATAPNGEARSTRVEAADGFCTKEYDVAEKFDEMLEAVKGMCKGVMDRMDAMEAEHKKDRKDRADAAERAEREVADAAAAAAVAAKQRADAAEDPRAFVDAQMRCDSAYQAWGRQAPHALQGESLRNFRIRLLSDLKQHSKRYRDSDLGTIGDEKVFCDIERAVVADAVEASCAPGAVGAPLVARTKVDPHTRHQVTTFQGDPGVAWAEFAGGSIMYGKINQDLINKATRAN